MIFIHVSRRPLGSLRERRTKCVILESFFPLPCGGWPRLREKNEDNEGEGLTGRAAVHSYNRDPHTAKLSGQSLRPTARADAVCEEVQDRCTYFRIYLQ